MLGDVLDLEQVPSAETNFFRRSADVLDRILMGEHRALFHGLGRFIKAGNRLVYVAGNHDYALRYPPLQRRFIDLLGLTALSVNITFADYYLDRHWRIYAEHGHLYDHLNTHHGGEEISFGTRLVRDFIVPWSERDFHPHGRLFSLLNNIRPRKNIIYYLNLLIREGKIAGSVKHKLLSDIKSVFRKAGMRGAAGAIDLMGRLLPGRAMDSIVGELLRENPTRYRLIARSLFNTIADKKDLNFQPQVIIMGHTHFLEKRSFGSARRYLNTGTWLDTVIVSSEGKVIAIDDKIRDSCPYLRIEKKNGVLQTDLISAADFSILNIRNLRRRFRRYGVEY